MSQTVLSLGCGNTPEADIDWPTLFLSPSDRVAGTTQLQYLAGTQNFLSGGCKDRAKYKILFLFFIYFG